MLAHNLLSFHCFSPFHNIKVQLLMSKKYLMNTTPSDNKITSSKLHWGIFFTESELCLLPSDINLRCVVYNSKHNRRIKKYKQIINFGGLVCNFGTCWRPLPHQDLVKTWSLWGAETVIVML